MRMRRIKGAEDFLASHPRVIQDGNSLNRELTYHVEIGCGKGDFILQLAHQHPEITFLAIEKNVSALYRAVQKYSNYQYANLFFLCGDVVTFQELLLSLKIAVIYLNFSDPWPKRRQAKNRLTHDRFTDFYHQVLLPEGEIKLKTDNYPFYLFSIENFVRHGFTLVRVDTDFPVTESSPVSEYEQKFREQGIKINYLELKKVE